MTGGVVIGGGKKLGSLPGFAFGSGTADFICERRSSSEISSYGGTTCTARAASWLDCLGST